jgi:hypothetical protein
LALPLEGSRWLAQDVLGFGRNGAMPVAPPAPVLAPEKMPAALEGDAAQEYFEKLEKGQVKAYPNSKKWKLELVDKTDWMKGTYNCIAS